MGGHISRPEYWGDRLIIESFQLKVEKKTIEEKLAVEQASKVGMTVILDFISIQTFT